MSSLPGLAAKGMTQVAGLLHVWDAHAPSAAGDSHLLLASSGLGVSIRRTAYGCQGQSSDGPGAGRRRPPRRIGDASPGTPMLSHG